MAEAEKLVFMVTRGPDEAELATIPFVMAASAYLIATAVIHLLLPRLEPMKFDEEPKS